MASQDTLCCQANRLIWSDPVPGLWTGGQSSTSKLLNREFGLEKKNELGQNKTNRVTYVDIEDSGQPQHLPSLSESLLSAWRKFRSFTTL